jgi:mRNA-degrading endonuclease RelE of RelBE toxin-antitoxin system
VAFAIKIVPSALRELEEIRVFDRRRLIQAIEEQLTHEPTATTRNRKHLPDLDPPFDCEPPVWELRVGDYRVFYDVDDDTVFVRAIRAKLPHQTTEQSL